MGEKNVPVPDFQSIMLPLLKLTSDGNVWSAADLRSGLAKHFNLTEADLRAMLPSGRQALFVNRVAWAYVHMQKAGLLDRPTRGNYQITDRGRALLNERPARIDMSLLGRYPEYVVFRTRTPKKPDEAGGDPPPTPEDQDTPEEILERAHQQLHDQLAEEILTQVKSATPEFFERLVVALLVKMGYGGSLKDAGLAVGKSGDEGIDGIIKEDRLGLDVIYIQAKKWDSTVGRPEIQRFVGALHGRRARKGVFITTGTFSGVARGTRRTSTPWWSS